MKIKVRRVRISFADDIFNARAMEGDDNSGKKFAGEFIIAPDHQDVKALEAAIDKAGSEKWGNKWPALKKKLDSEGRLCLRKTPRTNQEGETYEGYEDMYWIRSSSKVRPKVRDLDGKTDLTQEDGRIYSGCWVNAILDVYAHVHPKGGMRVLAQLKGVQFVQDDDAFGGGAPASDDDFDDESTEGGEDLAA